MAAISHVVEQVEVPARCNVTQVGDWIAQGLTNLRATDITRTPSGLHFQVLPTVWRLPLDPLRYVDSGRLAIEQTGNGYTVKYDLDCTPSFVVLGIIFLALCLAFAVGVVLDPRIAPIGMSLLVVPLMGGYARGIVNRNFSAWLRILPNDHAR
jgi:hypothetical protein